MRYTSGLVLCVFAVTGCQSAGTPATQPTPAAALVAATTAGDDGLDLIVNTVRIALDMKLLDGATYWRDYDPAITAGQAALHQMQAHAAAAARAEQGGDAATAAGEAASAGVSRDALQAAVQKLRPLADALRAKGAALPPGTQKGT